MLEALEPRHLFAAAPKVYVIGNSMTDGLNYAGFPQLLALKGTVTFGRQTGAGYSINQNYELDPTSLATSGIDPARPTVGNPWGKYTEAFTRPWDALTVQPHDRRLLTDIWEEGPYAGMNVADVPYAEKFLRAFAAKSASGQMYVYSRTVRRTDVTETMQPTGRTFDYSAEWLKTYVDSGENANSNFISRSYVKQYMPLLRQAQDSDAVTKPMKDVRLIPVGEAYYLLDQAIKAGKFAGTGVTSIKDFYLDQSHPTNDLGSYTIALSFYASITGTDPRGVAPPSAYLSTDRIKNTKVQQLIQQAVYDAIISSHYTGYTTPLTTTAGKGTVQVRAFYDPNRDGVQQTGENGIGGLTAYLDIDNDGVKDSAEPSAVTASTGLAVFSNVPVGTYTARVVTPPSGYAVTKTPASFTLSKGTTATRSIGFAAATPPPPSSGTSTITGSVVNDLNRDGKWTSGESAIAGRTVWLDLDNDGVIDSTEPKAVTNSSGKYTFSNLAAGTYRLRQVVPSGWLATLPVNNLSLSATVAAGATRGNVNFFTYGA